MKIVTWNIGGGFTDIDGKMDFSSEDIEYYSKELKKINPDIVCFQEIHVSENGSQPEMIANALGLNYVRYQVTADSHIKNGEGLAMAILSRYPIRSERFHQLTNPMLTTVWEDGTIVQTHDKGILEAVIDYDGHDIRVLSGHMVPFRKFGANFMDDIFIGIRKEIETICLESSIPTLIGMDLNHNTVHPLIPKIFEFGFKLANDESIVTTPKGRYYDKILFSPHWKLKNCSIIPGRSDHFLCVAEFSGPYID